MTCYSHDVWFPRTFPVRAKYDHYGSVHEVQEGPQTETWLRGLKLDLIEKGWGDNAAHDVPTRKTMTFSALLEAVREGRIHVSNNYDPYGPPPEENASTEPADSPLGMLLQSRRESRQRSVPDGIPTRRRVEKAVVALGYQLAESYKDGLLVSQVDVNTVKVRAGDGHTGIPHGKRVHRLATWISRRLQAWARHCGLPKRYVDRMDVPPPSRQRVLLRLERELSKRWAGMVCSGTGRYADEAELLLRPRVGVRSRMAEKREAPLCVSHAMIREDVWQALCSMPIAHNYGGPSTVEEARAATRAAWERHVGTDVNSLLVLLDGRGGEARMVTSDEVPFTVGLGSHWRLMVAAWNLGEVTEAERDDFLSAAGEVMHISAWLATVRYQWHPSGASGPQCGEWGSHAAFLDACLKISVQHRNEDEARRRVT